MPFPAPIQPQIAGLESSKIVELWQMGFGVENLIPLWVGEGNEPTPEFICDAANDALKSGICFYSQKRGLPELRQELAGYMARTFDIPLDQERVTVTTAGMNGIMLMAQTVAGPGDNVVCVTPGWPNVMGAIEIMGAEARQVSLDQRDDGGFTLDLERLFANCDEHTKALFIVSPSNPTGWMITEEEQREVLAFCRKRGIWLIADEVYHRFVYEQEVGNSFLQIADPEDALVVVNSFSKAWAMTGWRMGWLTHPASLGPVLDNLIEFNTSGTQGFLQHGCIAALRGGEPFVKQTVERCRQGRDLVFQRLSAVPRVRATSPKGAFYFFFAVEGMTDSLNAAKKILHETGVGLAPGSAFGKGGEGNFRLCYAGTLDRLSEAMDRLIPILGEDL
ncbi:pyridoxal phosphate-dependent aminotransferase [Denitrobaculum tricleocarpae]|uniref:Aminotransferase n=1 Tax=Denitrobaculum tricleocarpae TaxID=2591009 RepID=A0A545TRE0_9PROT|nr:pyridoxal phosphate-dependent aminotransferase [Denitrobaculum tricleocarpae]TQV79691.1 aminotransferase class I/II-fold pyridoxal phosphate-dependent enzyme [Denitrobaculum tricleocarpae]